jgi:hypothetical protein
MGVILTEPSSSLSSKQQIGAAFATAKVKCQTSSKQSCIPRAARIKGNEYMLAGAAAVAAENSNDKQQQQQKKLKCTTAASIRTISSKVIIYHIYFLNLFTCFYTSKTSQMIVSKEKSSSIENKFWHNKVLNKNLVMQQLKRV